MNGSPQNSEAVGSRRSGLENSDDEDWSTVVECAVLERSKTDRVTRSDEDRRRRTIIVEKKNGSYGFTLQSYGIHYKREQEIEMVTYVDYVEYDGPAFKAGMREGDVILSINGHEMDRADHKTLVNFIKNCDARMRMVVSFEDCVRKVELHMRYIELQRALQSRLSELERLCEREKSILMGRWKTHSLPARKRTPNCGASDQTPGSGVSTLNTSTVQCCRPATSTEHLLLYSVYADGRPCLIPRSTACLVAVGPPRSRSDHHHFLSKASNDSTISSRHSYHQANGSSTPAKSKAVHKTPSPSCSSKDSNPHHTSSHTSNSLCVACISSANRRRDPADGGSLDVYDLASPCCDPNCVPSRRRREKQRRARNEAQQAQQAQQIQQQTQQQTQQIQQPQHHNQKEHNQGQQHTGHSCPRSSGHSLHSITSSDVSTTVESGASCSTSLSTDTLYWDPNVQHRPPPCIQYPKPKSWDNLTTKAFGGYGFGYGYLDTASIKTHSAERPGKGHRAKTPTSSGQRRSGGSVYSGSSSGTSNRHFQPTKSTESLLGQSPYQSEVDSSSLSCECLDGNTRFLHKRQEEATYAGGSGHHLARNRRSSHGDGKLRTPANASSEVTRL